MIRHMFLPENIDHRAMIAIRDALMGMTRGGDDALARSRGEARQTV